jgi:hypothetical protein
VRDSLPEEHKTAQVEKASALFGAEAAVLLAR